MPIEVESAEVLLTCFSDMLSQVLQLQRLSKPGSFAALGRAKGHEGIPVRPPAANSLGGLGRCVSDSWTCVEGSGGFKCVKGNLGRQSGVAGVCLR